MSGLKACAGLGLALSDRAEHDAAPGARNAVVPAQALPTSSRIAARHLRKPISPDMFLERPVYNPHQLDPVPLPFASPMTVDDFIAWREDGNGGMKTSPSGSSIPNIDVPLARSKKEKKDKKDKGLNTGRKTKRTARPKDTPHGDAPPPPPLGDAPAFPPPPPGPAPPPPI